MLRPSEMKAAVKTCIRAKRPVCIWGKPVINHTAVLERIAAALESQVDDQPWPFCEACGSYHHPNNPTCRKKTAGEELAAKVRGYFTVPTTGQPVDFGNLDGDRDLYEMATRITDQVMQPGKRR